MILVRLLHLVFSPYKHNVYWNYFILTGACQSGARCVAVQECPAILDLVRDKAEYAKDFVMPLRCSSNEVDNRYLSFN